MNEEKEKKIRQKAYELRRADIPPYFAMAYYERKAKKELEELEAKQQSNNTFVGNNTSKSPNRVLINELIHKALSSKLKAIAGYDEIIWKIRAGYLAILYGALAIILGTKGITNWDSIVKDPARIKALKLLILGFSFSALLVDLGYVKKKLKVVVAYDRLIDIVIFNSENLDRSQSNLLHITGEAQPFSSSAFCQKLLWNLGWIILPLYAIAPILAFIVF